METSPLANLSPELRNQIYTYVFHTQIIDLDTTSHLHLEDPLVQTCRQIRSETHLLDLRNTTIKITPPTFPYDSHPLFPSRLENFVDFLGPRRCRALREIDVGGYRIWGPTRYEQEKNAFSQRGAGNEVRVFQGAYAVAIPIVQAGMLEQVEGVLRRVGLVLHSVRVRGAGRLGEETVFVMAGREDWFDWG
ncbi:hypothetical protein NU195Hw_g3593t1 [Hortaea werneckii]